MEPIRLGAKRTKCQNRRKREEKKENEINSFFIRTNINNFAKRKAIFILRCHTKQAEIEKRLEESEIWCK